MGCSGTPSFVNAAVKADCTTADRSSNPASADFDSPTKHRGSDAIRSNSGTAVSGCLVIGADCNLVLCHLEGKIRGQRTELAMVSSAIAG